MEGVRRDRNQASGVGQGNKHHYVAQHKDHFTTRPKKTTSSSGAAASADAAESDELPALPPAENNPLIMLMEALS